MVRIEKISGLTPLCSFVDIFTTKTSGLKPLMTCTLLQSHHHKFLYLSLLRIYFYRFNALIRTSQELFSLTFNFWMHGFILKILKTCTLTIRFCSHLQFLKLARNTTFASLQPFRSIRYTSSMSVPCIHRISDFLSEPSTLSLNECSISNSYLLLSIVRCGWFIRVDWLPI